MRAVFFSDESISTNRFEDMKRNKRKVLPEDRKLAKARVASPNIPVGVRCQ